MSEAMREATNVVAGEAENVANGHPKGAGLSEFVEIRYLDPSECAFERTPGGLLALEVDGERYPRVALHRAFPFTLGDRYISVRDPDGKEIGIIEDLEAFPPETADAVREELDRRYFTPEIIRIKSMKEEFGYSYWDVVTDRGERRFTVRDLQRNLLLLSERRLLLIDVDGNRFAIPDYTALDAAGRRIIEDLI